MCFIASSVEVLLCFGCTQTKSLAWCLIVTFHYVNEHNITDMHTPNHTCFYTKYNCAMICTYMTFMIKHSQLDICSICKKKKKNFFHRICSCTSMPFSQVKCIQLELTVSHHSFPLFVLCAVDTSVPEPLPLAPPSSPNGVNKCTIYLILLVAAILWVATLGVALYALK